MKMDNQGSVQVQNVIGWIIQNHLANDESSGKSKELMMNLVVQTEDVKFSIQRLHLLYGICEALENENEKVAKDFFVHLFPLPLRKNSASFINQLVSLAICLNTKQVLTATAMYIEKEQVKLSDEDLKRLSPDLAKCSPVFAAILIDRISSHFYTASIKSTSLSSTDLLTQWLVSLNDCNESEKITFNGQSLIRYSLIGQGSRNSDLHYNILNAIQKKRIQPLSNQFVIDIATQLSQKGDEQLCSKYAQILIMAVQNGLCNTLVSSNQMKNNLTALFPNNLLIKAIGGMKPSKS